MKHLLSTIIVLGLTCTAAVAQEKPAAKVVTEVSATLQSKESVKEKKEAELAAAFKAAGVTAEEEQKVRAILAESTAFYKTLKADASLDEEAIKARSKEYSTIRNANLKAALGDDKYKVFKQVQKEQKEAAEAAKN